jgi:hypothetical protein
VSFRPWTLLLSLVLLPIWVAEARVEETCGYTKGQVFQSALRFIRVDNGFRLAEKDESAGYLLFEYPTGEGEFTTPASIEIIERSSQVQFVFRIPKLAEHHERLLVRRFLEKLKSEYGEPPPSKPRRDKPSEKEEPSEDDEGENEDKVEESKNEPKAPRSKAAPSRSKAEGE